MWIKGVENFMLIERVYTLHEHFRKSQHRSHWDLRILSINKKFALSFVIPKQKFPDETERKILVIRTPDHSLSALNLQGTLENNDTMKILEKGKCTFVSYADNKIDVIFHGRIVRGHFIFVKLDENGWLLIGKRE